MELCHKDISHCKKKRFLSQEEIVAIKCVQTRERDFEGTLVEDDSYDGIIWITLAREKDICSVGVPERQPAVSNPWCLVTSVGS